MTTHPLNVPVSSSKGTPSKIVPQGNTPMVKSKNIADNASNSISSPSGRGQFITTEAASLDLSAEGINRLQHANRSPIQNKENAKAVMKSVTDHVKENPEQNASLHANLRAMRINQLVFD